MEKKWIPYPCDICGKPAFWFANPMPNNVLRGEVASARCSDCCDGVAPELKITQLKALVQQMGEFVLLYAAISLNPIMRDKALKTLNNPTIKRILEEK